MKLAHSNVEVCKYRVSVYAPKTTHVIAAPTGTQTTHTDQFTNQMMKHSNGWIASNKHIKS